MSDETIIVLQEEETSVVVEETETLKVVIGEQGPKGAAGTKGDPGDKGDPGLSAYEVAVANEFEGTEEEWLENLRGPQGPAGTSPISSDTPQPLGTPDPGSTGEVSDAGHVHALPTANEIGATTPEDVEGLIVSELATYVQVDDLADVATTGDYNDLENLPTLGSAASHNETDFATAEQGEKADTAVQLGLGLGGVLSGHLPNPGFAVNMVEQTEMEGAFEDHIAADDPHEDRQYTDEQITALNLGSASQANTADFATAAQGATADTAVQPGDLAAVATSGAYSDLSGLPTLGSAAAADTTDFDAAGAAADALTDAEEYTDTQIFTRVPTTRTINGYDLSADVTLDFSDVGAEEAGTAESILVADGYVKNNGSPTSGSVAVWLDETTITEGGTLGSAAFASSDDFASTLEGTLATTALQPEEVGTAAYANLDTSAGLTSNDNTDVPTTAAVRSYAATAAQGAKADTAVQPATLGALATLNSVTTAEIANNTILNGDISPSAGIVLSKLETIADATFLGNNAGTTGTPIVLTVAQARTLLGLGSLALLSTITSSNITDGTIVNADISNSAAIALSKLATDPLARSNHTGTQTLSTISDAGTLASKNFPWLSMLHYSGATNEYLLTNEFLGSGATSTTWGGTTTLSNGLYWFMPWIAPLSCSVKSADTYITALNAGASAVWDVVLFNDNGSRAPGTVLRQCGTASINSTGVKALAFSSTAVTAGTLYWIGCGFRGLDTAGANPAVECAASIMCDLAPKTAVQASTAQYTQYTISGQTSGLSDNPSVTASAVTASQVRLPYVHLKVV